MVIIRIEKTELRTTKQATESVVAFRTSIISVRRLESLLDLYKPQKVKMIWQMRSAKTAIPKLTTLVLIERNRIREIAYSVLTIKTVVSAKENTMRIRSNNLTRLIFRRCLSFMIILHGTLHKVNPR